MYSWALPERLAPKTRKPGIIKPLKIVFEICTLW
jgi:hypothetical protein